MLVSLLLWHPHSKFLCYSSQNTIFCPKIIWHDILNLSLAVNGCMNLNYNIAKEKYPIKLQMSQSLVDCNPSTTETGQEWIIFN